MYLNIGPKGPYVPWELHTRIPTHANLRSGRHHLHLHHHHLHLLQTRYLLTGTRRNVKFFTTRLHGPLRCARTSSDRPSPPVRAKVRSWRLGWDALKDAIVALAHAFNLKALYARGLSPTPDSPRLETDGLLGLSVLCVSNSESYCVRRSRGYFNCLATGESFKLDGLLLPVFVSQIAVFAVRDRGPVRCRSICRWISGPALCCLSSAVC